MIRNFAGIIGFKLTQLLLGLLLPLYLLWLFLSGTFGAAYQQAVENAHYRLNIKLDRFARYHDDLAFFHALLQKNFTLADRSAGPEQALIEKVAAVRSFFSDRIRFIVWNSDGSINRNLSDEKRFQFVMKSMFQVMHMLADAFKVDETANPADIQKIVEKMNLLRGYFGQFLFENQLFEPLRPGAKGKCLSVSLEPGQKLLWYYPGSNFSLACFLDAALTGRHLGPKSMVRQAAATAEPERLAFVKTLSYQGFGMPAATTHQSEIMLEVKKYEADGQSQRQSRNYLLNIRQASPDLILISYLPATFLPDPHNLSARMLGRISIALMLALFVWHCYLLRHPEWCLSVRQKMLLLFIFSNGLPLGLMISAGYEFFHEKRDELFNAAHQESLRILKEFDVRFPETSAVLADRLNAFIDARNKKYGGKRWPDAEIEALQALVAEIGPEEGGLAEPEGNYTFYMAKTTNRASKMGLSLMQNALLFFGGKGETAGKKGQSSILEQVSSIDKSLYFFLGAVDRFSLMSSGNSERLTYVKFTGAQQQGQIWGILLLSWERATFLRDFISASLTQASEEVKPRILAVMDNDSEKIFSTTQINNPQINRLMRLTRSRKMIAGERVALDGKNYLFTSIAGNEIGMGVLVALYPEAIIEQQIFRLKLAIGIGFLLVVIILRQTVILFSHRLLAPVESLATGIEKVRKRDYSIRVPSLSNDELGRLTEAFNTTVEGMRELAVGTAVQVSLLPPEHHCRGKISLFARSLFMSKMGGDYYDYFDLPNDRMAIFFGDVAGHGIPAAMIMAMMKAMIAGVSRDFPGPAEVLHRGSCVLNELKKKDWRRMMTAQCLDFDCSSGAFKIANAGHCYPVMIGPGGNAPRLIEIHGFPLGSSTKNRAVEQTLALLPGATLILYTDGIVEAMAPSGEMLGYPRFLKMVADAWHADLETYWSRILEGHKAWTDRRDDDLTFLMLRMEDSSDA